MHAVKLTWPPFFQSHYKHLLRVVSVVCLCWAGSNLPCCAQMPSAGESPLGLMLQAPEAQVLDQANMFREDRKTLAGIEASLTRMSEKHDYPVYLAIYYNVFDQSLQELADELYNAWVGESGYGMVIVYQLDPVVSGGNPAIAYHKDAGLEMDSSVGSGPRPMLGWEMDVLLKRAFTAANKNPNEPIEFISALIYGIEAEMNRYHKVEPMSWNNPENLKLMFIFIVIIAAFAVIGKIAWKLLYPVNAKSRRVYYFPEVEVERRLGAPYGGGRVSEKTFDPAS